MGLSDELEDLEGEVRGEGKGLVIRRVSNLITDKFIAEKAYEPPVRSDIFQLLVYASRLGIYVTLATNGTFRSLGGPEAKAARRELCSS